MIKNYFKVAIRNLLNKKLYSFITIFGLAFGMACFLIISGYVSFESSYDNFQKNAKNIYRLDKEVNVNGETFYRSLVGASTAPLLQEEFPGIKNTVRFANLLYCFVGIDQNAYREKRFLFADSTFFSVFTFPLNIGNPETALINPFSVVITPQTARKYFGNKNPIGQTIFFQTKLRPGKFGFTITGITKKIPSNSTIKFDFLASFSSLHAILGDKFISNNWDGPFWTYVQLKNNYDPKEIEKMFPAFAKKYIPKAAMNAINFRLVPLRDTYYNKGDGIPLGDWGIKPISYLLLVVSFLVLLIAAINYTNLLSANSIVRAKEIGVRKVHGANRFQLTLQFIGESVLTSLISFLFAIVLVELLLPSFQSLLREVFPSFGILPQREVSFNIFNTELLIFMLAVTIIVGIISGIYPAVVLSKYDASDVLKGELRKGKISSWFRKILVIIQFAVSVIFIICSLHILLQINTWSNSNLGFDKKSIITIPVYEQSVIKKYNLLKNKLLQSSGIINVTSSNLIPGGIDSNILLFRSGKVKDLKVITYFVDADFIKTLGLKILKGRDFSASIPDGNDEAILMNRAAIKACGWKGVNGQEIELYTKQNDKTKVYYTGKLIGEVKDFRYRFFKPADEPLILKINPKVMNYILIRVNKVGVDKTIAYIKSTWKEMKLGQAFEYSNLTDELNISYSMYKALDSFIFFAAIITMIIAILGLFALASFVIERKTKEIGIRKVMGASVKDIIFNLSKSFLLLVIIAEVIAIPAAYKVTTLLLQQLPYHIRINFWLILLSSVFVLVFSFAIVGLKSLKAATVNPVISLRSE